MTTRLAYFFSNRAQATSDRLNDGARGWIGEEDNIGSSTGTVPSSGSTDIAGTSVSPFIHSNRKVKITATATLTNASSASSWAVVVVQGSTVVDRIGRVDLGTTETRQVSGSVWTDNGTAGNTEFHLAIQSISGSGTCTVANTTPAEARILVEDVGDAG